MLRAPAALPLGLVVLIFRLGATQSPPSTYSSGPGPVIKVTTRLIQVSVVVHDRHGNPVSDLKKEDFEISDQGKRQTISLFSLDSLTGASLQAPAAVPGVPIVQPTIISNRPEHRTNSPTSVTVLVLDMYNTKLTDQMLNRRQIVKFLHQLRPTDRVAVYLLQGTGFRVVHDFTNNGESLVASLAKVFPGFSSELDNSQFDPSNTGNDDVDAAVDASNTMMANFYTRSRILNSCIAFKMLAQHLMGVPGRKNVVWLSGGFPIGFGYGDESDSIDRSAQMTGAAASDKEMLADYIREASDAMSTANVAVYPVDARGLMGLPMADASRNFKVDPRTHQIPQSAMRVDTKNIEAMNYIADLTGGRAYYNTNDIGGAVRKAIEDSAVTYTLGYYVPESTYDGKFHKLKVKVERSGVSVRTKRGYLAREEPAPNSNKLAQLLHEAVWSPLDSTSIGLSARVDPSPVLPEASRIVFALEPSELQLKRDGEKFTGALDIVFVQETRRGKRLTDFKKTLSFRVSPDQLEAMKSQSLSAGQDLKINSETETVRVVVLDRDSGRAGSVTVPIRAQDRSSASTPDTTKEAPSPAAQKPPVH